MPKTDARSRYKPGVPERLLSIDGGELVISDEDTLEEGIKSAIISTASDLDHMCSDADGKGDCSDEPIKIDKLSDDSLKSKHFPFLLSESKRIFRAA